jgi:hypothetical protein
MDHFQAVFVSPLSSSRRNAAATIEKPTVHAIGKDIVDVIIGDMYYATPSHLLQESQDKDGDCESSAACFGSAAVSILLLMSTVHLSCTTAMMRC